MNDFEKIMSGMSVTSMMMEYEGGTKFYEVLLLSTNHVFEFDGKQYSTTNSLCLTRWGANHSKLKNGTFGKGKILNGGPKATGEYAQAIIGNKLGRGCMQEGTKTYQAHNAIRIAEAYRLIEHVAEDPATNTFFQNLGLKVSVINALGGNSIPTDNDCQDLDLQKPQKQINRSPLFGSW